MSTRANIAIKLKAEDKYIALNYLDKRFDDVRPSIRTLPWVNNMPIEQTYDDTYCNSTEDTSFDYLQIYNHHDGYPDHLYEVLKRYYNSYERALSLILAGDTSAVSKDATEAYAVSEGYDDVRPTPMEMPRCNEEYLYVFENDTWNMSR